MLTIKQAANLLGVTPARVLDLVDSGELPFRAGRMRILISGDDVRAYINARKYNLEHSKLRRTQ